MEKERSFNTELENDLKEMKKAPAATFGTEPKKEELLAKGTETRFVDMSKIKTVEDIVNILTHLEVQMTFPAGKPGEDKIAHLLKDKV